MKKSEEKIRIVLAGGGTGGHIYPVAAVAQQLKDKADLLWIGTKDKIDRSEIVAKQQEIDFQPINAGKLRRYFSLENIFSPFQVLVGIFQASSILGKYKPDVVFAKGGYASLPVVLAAHWQNVPIVIHESDVLMGLANQISAQYASKICVSFSPKYYPTIREEKLIETGLPVRGEFFKVNKKRKVKKPLLLIYGGVQGAMSINQLVAEALPELVKLVDVVHITGPTMIDEYKKIQQPGYEPIAFSDDMSQLLADADLIITRSSATNFAEIAAVGRPAILVPSPTVAGNHQEKNAVVWEKAGAAIVFNQDKLSAKRLSSTIERLVNQPKVLEEMGRAAHSFARPYAAKEIADLLLEQSKKSR